MDRQTTIYLLRDPRDSSVRYIGKTIRPLAVRLRLHADKRVMTPVARWVRKLRQIGLRPDIEAIETVVLGWQDREKYWISYYRDSGVRLLNLADGGDGPHGWKHTDEARAKIRAASLGRKHSPETIAEMKKRTCYGPEFGAKISVAKKGRVTVSPEQRARISKTLTGRKMAPQLPRGPLSASRRERLSETTRKAWDEGRMKRRRRTESPVRTEKASARRGPMSPEHKAKIGASNKRRWATLAIQDPERHAAMLERFASVRIAFGAGRGSR